MADVTVLLFSSILKWRLRWTFIIIKQQSLAQDINHSDVEFTYTSRHQIAAIGFLGGLWAVSGVFNHRSPFSTPRKLCMFKYLRESWWETHVCLSSSALWLVCVLYEKEGRDSCVHKKPFPVPLVQLTTNLCFSICLSVCVCLSALGAIFTIL